MWHGENVFPAQEAKTLLDSFSNTMPWLSDTHCVKSLHELDYHVKLCSAFVNGGIYFAKLSQITDIILLISYLTFIRELRASEIFFLKPTHSKILKPLQ